MRMVYGTRSTRARLAMGALTLGALLLVPLSGQVHAAGGVVLQAHYVVGHHYSKVETQSTTTKVVAHVKDAKGKLVTQTQTSVEVDVTPSTTTVTRILADGSAVMKVTYGTCTVTTNGKVEKSAMTGFYEEKTVGNNLHVISAKYIGGKGIPADILSNVTSNDSVKVTRGTDGYPSTPVKVGSSWSAVATIPPFASVTMRTALLGFGTQSGRATVTVRQTISQPVTFSSQGLTYKGKLATSQTQTAYVDDGAEAQPTNNTLNFTGTFSNNTGSTTGTVSISGIDRTVPSA